jgi:hypothetical protein
MLPKASKHYIIPTATDLDLDSQLVEEVVSFYYSTLRKTLSELKCYNVQVENIGTFKAKSKELPKLIAKYKKHLSVLNTETFRGMRTKKDVEEKLAKVVALQDQINETRKRKQEFIKNKKNGNTGTNMES